MENNQFTVMISAGEASGDEHGAKFLLALKKIAPDVSAFAMGGSHLRAADAEIVIDLERSASVMGISEVITSLPSLLATFNQAKRVLNERKPNLLVLIDYPDFNLRLASEAKRLGIAVLYFIPPKVWAWREKRVQQIKDRVSDVAFIFPHEKDFYAQRGMHNTHYVGHPFATLTTLLPYSTQEKEDQRCIMGLDPVAPLLAILPGSRPAEIKRHLQIVIEAFKILKSKLPAVQAIVPVPSSIDIAQIQASIPESLPIKIIRGESEKVLKIADAGLLKSGTSNLQAAFCELPFAMFYITAPLTAWVARTFVKLKSYSPVNIIKNGTVEEILQEDATPEKLAETALQLLSNKDRREAIQRNEREVVGLLKGSDETEIFNGLTSAYERVAALAMQIINNQCRK